LQELRDPLYLMDARWEYLTMFIKNGSQRIDLLSSLVRISQILDSDFSNCRTAEVLWY